MALPKTQKECTTRRIAALISGLWDKVKNAFLLKTSRGAANGVASLDSNGKVPTSQLPTVPIAAMANNLPRSFINKKNQTTKVWKKVATSKVYTTYDGSSITFLICGDGYNSVLGLNSINSISIKTGSNGKLDSVYIGKYNFRDHCSVELLKIGNTNQYEIWVKALLSDTNAQIVYLNSQGEWTIDSTDDQSSQKTDSEYSTYKSSNPSVASSYYHIYNVVKSSTSQTGGPSIPVFVNSSGELVACTNIPVIEHVTSIPVNPTVGTIYAL